MSEENSIEAFLVQRISRVLDVAPESINTQATYAELGLDSMSLIGLTGEIEQMTGVVLGPKLLETHNSIAKISQYIEDNKSDNA